MAKKHHEHGTEHTREASAESVERTPERDEEFPETVSAREAATAQPTAPDQGEVAERPETTAESLAGGLAETAESVMTSVKEEATEAREAAAGIIPTLDNAIHQGVYSSFYYLTYGIVFSALVVGRWIPSNNAMGEGVHDGAEAARKTFEDSSRRTGEPATEEEGLAPA